MMKLQLDEIQQQYPFLSLVKVGAFEHIGIIQNKDTRVISLYCYDMVPDAFKEKFLKFGKIWWWESNRKIPINLFIGKEFDIMKSCLSTYSVKESIVEFGPIVSLSDLTLNKRYRKKTVQLIRRVD